jgi:hypothetical protein
MKRKASRVMLVRVIFDATTGAPLSAEFERLNQYKRGKRHYARLVNDTRYPRPASAARLMQVLSGRWLEGIKP